MVKPVWPDIFCYLPQSDDAPERLELKAWVHDDASHQWELRRLLAFIAPRRPLRLGKYMARELAAPRQLLVELFGGDDVLRSEVQVLKSKEELADDVQDQWSTRTRGFICFAVWCAMGPSAREPTRTSSLKFLFGFFQRFLAEADVKAAGASECPPEAAEHCDGPKLANGLCHHVSASVRCLQGGGEVGLRRLLTVLRTVFEGGQKCKAMRFWFGHWLLQVSRAVDLVLRHGQWQEDALKSQPVSTSLKRQSYIDSDVKAAAIAETRKRRMPSVPSFMAARGDERGAGSEQWVHQAMREEVAKGWLAWSGGGVCFIAPDAFRAGTEDTLCVQFWHASSCTGGWLPPQVTLCVYSI